MTHSKPCNVNNYLFMWMNIWNVIDENCIINLSQLAADHRRMKKLQGRWLKEIYLKEARFFDENLSNNGFLVAQVAEWWEHLFQSCRFRFDFKWVGSNQLHRNWYSQLPCLTLSIEGTEWRTSRQVCLLCRWERHLAGFLHLSVVNRRPVAPSKTLHSALIA